MSFYYLVRQGDYLSKIAFDQGFSDWRTIYNHPLNTDFRSLRPNPNLLYPGDRLYIPDRSEGALSAPTGQRTRFRTHRGEDYLELALVNFRSEPLRNTPYRLSLDGAIQNGKTDGQGKLRRSIPADTGDVRLTIGGTTLILRVGNLDPMDDTDDGGLAGVMGRLSNLGYCGGAASRTMNENTSAAIRAFQQDHSLTETGEISQPLKDKLREIHGS